jgi:hypothetical protein
MYAAIIYILQDGFPDGGASILFTQHCTNVCSCLQDLALCHGSGDHNIISQLLYRARVPAMTTATRSYAVDRVAALLQDNICPVCFCKKLL